VRIGDGEAELREQVKAAGGFWSPEKKAWRVTCRKGLDLGLEMRVVEEGLGF